MSDFITGRTGWDVLANGKSKLFYAAVLIGGGILLWQGSRYVDMETIKTFIIGLGLGWILTSYLTRPVGRFVLSLNGDKVVRLVFIPDDLYSHYNIAGNAFCFTSKFGFPVYLAKSIDTDARSIDYGYVHMCPEIRAFADIKFFNEWYDKFVAVQTENIILKKRVSVLAAELTKISQDRTIRAYDVALGFTDPIDSDSDDKVRDFLNSVYKGVDAHDTTDIQDPQ